MAKSFMLLAVSRFFCYDKIDYKSIKEVFGMTSRLFYPQGDRGACTDYCKSPDKAYLSGSNCYQEFDKTL